MVIIPTFHTMLLCYYRMGRSSKRAVHFEANAGRLGIFCDGSFSRSINSSVWVIDESALESGESPTILYNATLPGSHHGVAIPVFENHLLYSVALPERISRSANGSDYSLPSHFNVIEIPSGTIIHQLNELLPLL